MRSAPILPKFFLILSFLCVAYSVKADTQEDLITNLEQAATATLFGEQKTAQEKLHAVEAALTRGADLNVSGGRESLLEQAISGSASASANSAIRAQWIAIGKKMIDRGADYRTIRAGEFYRENGFGSAIWAGIPELVEHMLGKSKEIVNTEVFSTRDEAYTAARVALKQADRLGTHKAEADVYLRILDLLVNAGANLDALLEQSLGGKSRSVSLVAYFAAVGNDQAVTYLLGKKVSLSQKDLEYVKSIDEDCNRRFGSLEPFSDSTPSYCRRSADRKFAIRLLESRLFELDVEKSALTHPPLHR